MIPVNSFCWGASNMSRTARPWRGAGLLLLGGALLSGARAFGADEPPMSNQLADLGRQALAQGANRTAETFFKKALELDPANAAAADGLRSRARRPASSGWRCKSPGSRQAAGRRGQARGRPARRRLRRRAIPRPPSSRPRRPRTSPGSN